MNSLVLNSKHHTRYQFMEDMFDIKFKTYTVDEFNLFDLQQHYVYSVFTNTLLTNKWKSSVRTHDSSGNVPIIHI